MLYNTNYSIPEHAVDIYNLNSLLLGDSTLQYRAYPRHISDPDELRELFEFPNNDIYLTHIRPTLKIPRAAVADWTTAIVNHIASQEDTVYYELVSKALTTRSATYLVFKVKDTFLTVTTDPIADVDVWYKLTLACMLIEHQDNESLVARLSEAITTSKPVTLVQDELDLLEAHRQNMIAAELETAVELLSQSVRPRERINKLYVEIERTEALLARLYKDIQGLQHQDYAITVQLDSTQADLKDYLRSADIVAKESHYMIKSYMYIDLTNKDFFKSSAITNSRHPLYAHPDIKHLLEDVMHQQIRVPIYATFRINPESSRPIHGTAHLPMTEPRPINTIGNIHINEYDCFDGYRNQAIKALTSLNYIEMFEVLKMATASINPFDGPVMRRIIEQLIGLSPNTIVEYKTAQGWDKIRLEEYYEIIKSKHQPNETVDS